MAKIDVSNGELIDKITILEIKKENGLPVEKELKLLSSVWNYSWEIKAIASILKEVNKRLWEIEDTKRECEKEQSFDSDFIKLSRLVYMLNDERARLKKLIDKISDSEITEYKSHD